MKFAQDVKYLTPPVFSLSRLHARDRENDKSLHCP